MFLVLENEGYFINIMNSDMEWFVLILKNKYNLKQNLKKIWNIYYFYLNFVYIYFYRRDIYIGI